MLRIKMSTHSKSDSLLKQLTACDPRRQSLRYSILTQHLRDSLKHDSKYVPAVTMGGEDESKIMDEHMRLWERLDE